MTTAVSRVFQISAALGGLFGSAAIGWTFSHTVEGALTGAIVFAAFASLLIVYLYGARGGGLGLLVLGMLLSAQAGLKPAYTGPWLESILSALSLFCAGTGMLLSGTRKQQHKEAVVAGVSVALLTIGGAFLLHAGTASSPFWLTIIAVVAVVANRLSGAIDQYLQPGDRVWLGVCAGIAFVGAAIAVTYPDLPDKLNMSVREMLHDFGVAAIVFPMSFIVSSLITVRGRAGWRHLITGFFVHAFGFWLVWQVWFAEP